MPETKIHYCLQEHMLYQCFPVPPILDTERNHVGFFFSISGAVF